MTKLEAQQTRSAYGPLAVAIIKRTFILTHADTPVSRAGTSKVVEYGVRLGDGQKLWQAPVRRHF